MAFELPESNFKLQDRTALLTGPCDSLHQAIAMKFTQLGANVSWVSPNIDKTQRFVQQLIDAREVNDRFGRAHAIASDLSTTEEIQSSITKAAEAFGGIDIFVDGMLTTDVKPFRDPEALVNIDDLINANLKAPLLLTHGVLKFLEARKRGRVIYLMHDIVRMGLPQHGSLACTRSGLATLSRTLSREVSASNITFNCVSLGITEEFLLSHYPNENISIQEAQSRLLQSYPFAQMIEPDKIANVVAFLASPLGAGITGQTIAVSHGLSYLS